LVFPQFITIPYTNICVQFSEQKSQKIDFSSIAQFPPFLKIITNVKVTHFSVLTPLLFNKLTNKMSAISRELAYALQNHPNAPSPGANVLLCISELDITKNNLKSVGNS
jgi:hypothetical protein